MATGFDKMRQQDGAGRPADKVFTSLMGPWTLARLPEACAHVHSSAGYITTWLSSRKLCPLP